MSRLLKSRLSDKFIVDNYINRLQLSIELALTVSYRRKLSDSKTPFVAHISLVKGVPFYGYHVGYNFFLKIYMLNPLYMTRLADLLRQGTIMKKDMQPYESHLQYLAQWMCDFNLYGCAYIDFRMVRFRSPVPEFSQLSATKHKWHDRTIPASHISDDDKVPRQSHCSLEVDVCAQDILNRLDIASRPLHHDFVECKHPINTSEKLVHSMAELWRDETRRRRSRMGVAESSPFPPEALVSVSADPRNSQPDGWIHEEDYLQKIKTIIDFEQNKSGAKKLDFETFISKTFLEAQIKTSFESVGDLFPENLKTLRISARASQLAKQLASDGSIEEAEVDQNRVLSFMEDNGLYESDAESGRESELSPNKQEGFSDEQDGLLEPPGVPEAEQDDNGIADSAGTLVAPKSVEDVQGPTSSTELEALGIRHAGDYGYVEADMFEIPLECTKDTSLELNHRKREKSLRPESKHGLKRRKFFNNELFNLSSTPNKIVNHPQLDSEHHALFVNDQVAASQTNNDNIPQESTQNTLFRQQIAPKRKFTMLKSSSQERHTSNSIDGTRILSFPIVKDLQDPTTILKLSQRSNSPIKHSQTSQSISLRLEQSDGTISEQSTVQGLLSFKQSLTPTMLSSQILRLSSQLHEEFDVLHTKSLMCFAKDPPTTLDMHFEMRQAKIPSIIYQDAYYGKEKDVPERSREYAGKEFKIESITLPYLPDFDPTGTSAATRGDKASVVIDRNVDERMYQKQRTACDLRVWEIANLPPTRLEIQKWMQQKYGHDGIGQSRSGDSYSRTDKDLSQIDSVTQKNKHGFKYSQKQESASVQHETQYMSLMSLEIHTNTRGSLLPNPEYDEINCIFWCIQSDDIDLEVNGFNEGTHVGIIALSEDGVLGRKISQQTNVEVTEESNELDLINRIVDIVRGYDPDILTGYEVHGGSWGYLIERAGHKYDYNLCDELSRIKSDFRSADQKKDAWGFTQTSTIRVTGRHMINIWRAMRGELNLLQYTMENVVFHLLHRRIPHYSYKDLTSWYNSGRSKNLAKVMGYYLSRVQLDLEILEQNELIPRTSEQARLLGVDFFSVFSRGSQFKVESLMFRIAKPENFLLPSPSRKQVGQQNALECLPLVMEPQSAFYTSPMLVLDFQSLYPSVMIAYNYCYSTFLGRVVSWRGQNKMGFTDYQREQGLLELFKDQINIAPNGIIYAKPRIRKSLLAKMLGEILETRVMVKSGMKADKTDKPLQRLLNNRQLALKLIANVTYGYTSASFSGRMPCSEIADSIVQTSRETLEKSIALIHSMEKWEAEVVYGDTDSLFVYLKGRTKDEAFDIGNEIAKTITDMNPRPIKLKFEKVYLPCVLLAKKRYVGFKYESKTQKEPDFDAKGIETVRRDGTPAEQKIEEKALKILFRTADLSEVKSYFQNQCTKIMRGKVSIQDFCFAREVKLGTYSEKGVPPPGVLISTRRMLEDPRAEPQYGERVPYVVISGAPGARLIDRCVAPDALLHDDQNELDAEYYITKNLIPPLERIFNLVGANVRQWYDEMPKFQRIRRIDVGPLAGGNDLVIFKKTLESYMKSSSCLVCREKLEGEGPICTICMQSAPASLLALRVRENKAEKKAINLEKICRSCASLAWGEEVRCDSKDCSIFYTRTRYITGLRNTRMGMEPTMRILEGMDNASLEW